MQLYSWFDIYLNVKKFDFPIDGDIKRVKYSKEKACVSFFSTPDRFISTFNETNLKASGISWINTQFIAYVDFFCTEQNNVLTLSLLCVSQEIAKYFEISNDFIQFNAKLLSYYLLFVYFQRNEAIIMTVT